MKKALLSIAIASAFGVAANAANTITIPDAVASPGGILYLEVRLTNDSPIAGFQANLSADKSGLVLGDATRGALTISSKNWIGSHSVSQTSYNVLCYNQNCNTYSATSAQKCIAVIPVTIPVSATIGTTYTITINNGILSDANGKTSTCATSTAKIKIVDSDTFYSQFNFNGDTDFDIDDVQFIFNAFADDLYDPKWDLNHDGAVDIDDVQIIFNYYGEY